MPELDAESATVSMNPDARPEKKHEPLKHHHLGIARRVAQNKARARGLRVCAPGVYPLLGVGAHPAGRWRCWRQPW